MRRAFLILIILILSFLLSDPVQGAGASLYLAPSRGTFFVGSTFNISIYVNTKGNEINAVQIDLRFPPDILQVTTPTAGESFISEWLTPPTYSNIGGIVSFKGGIPEGIVTSAGLISTITFRAKVPGTAKVELIDSSQVFLADGKGTPLSTTILNGAYEILIPPPEGPLVFSPTHNDSDIWYSDPNPQFYWEKETGLTDFSFSFSQNPQEDPDIVSEGDMTFISYEGVQDGIWYFHLRAKKRGVWGKTSHFAIKIDTTPPQEFKLQTDVGRGFVYFDTKDLRSGVDYYEVAVLNISKTPTSAPLFVEATSPFKISSRETGKYRVIVRVFDKAGNRQEGETRFQILSPFISYVEGEGIEIRGIFFAWQTIYLILLILIGIIAYLIFLSFKKAWIRKRTKIKQRSIEKD